MPEIKIKVRDKCAEGEGVVICNNSDYTVAWDLDGEWTPYDTKTMRVNLTDGGYQDVVFTGNTAALPVLSTPGWVSVGLYAGDIHTSRAARLLALSSVLTPGGSPAVPAEDVYAQIMAKLNELSTVSPEDIAKAVEDYLTEHPAASASMRVEGGYIQFSGDGKTWENVIALADLKGAPGSTGIESLWEEICEQHDGTKYDAIPYNGNMALEAGKYYTQDGVLYQCTRDTGNPVSHALNALVGIYVEVVENGS